MLYTSCTHIAKVGVKGLKHKFVHMARMIWSHSDFSLPQTNPSTLY